MTQQMQAQQQLQPQPPSEAARLFAVEKDVLGLKEGMSTLTSMVNEGFRTLGADLKAEAKARSTTNWAPISLLATVLIALGTLGIGYLSSNQTRLEAMIAKQEARTERFVPREDLDARFAVTAQRRDDLQRLTDARVERIERDLDVVSKQIVPRGEHDTIRQLQQRDYDLLRNRVERVEGRFEKRSDRTDRDIERLEDRTVPRVELQGRLDAQDRALGVVRGEVDDHVKAFNERQQHRIDTLDTLTRK